MVDDDVQERLGRLDGLLAELSELLESVGETDWLTWAQRSRARLRARDESSIRGILGVFAGMGSLNDLVLHRLNGHTVAEEDHAAVNTRLRDLTSGVWEEAVALRAAGYGRATGH